MRGVVIALEQTAVTAERMLSRIDPVALRAAVARIEKAKANLALAGFAFSSRWRVVEAARRAELQRLAGEEPRG